MRIPRLASHSPGDGPHPFRGNARSYDWMARYLMRRSYRRVAADAVADLPPRARVLDVGTGPGWLLVEIARLRPDLYLTGVDLDPAMVEAARRNLANRSDRATAAIGEAGKLPADDNSFDLVVSSLSLHHWAEPSAGGAELARVLSPGGQIRIYDLESAPFAALYAGATKGAVEGAATVVTTRFPLTALPWPALHRLVL